VRSDSMGRFRTIVIGIFISFAIFAGMIGAMVMFDLHLHKKFDKIAALNCRGYRGDVLGKKKAGEVRIGLFGGSIAMGYGVDNDKSIAGYLQAFFNERSEREKSGKQYTVINLGVNGEPGVSTFGANYSLMEYLDMDVMIFYFCNTPADDGYLQSAYCTRKENPVFRHFGYYFVFPTVFREKYYLLRYGNISEGYQRDVLFDRINSLLTPGYEEDESGAETLREFIDRLTDSGKIVIFLIAPHKNYKDRQNYQGVQAYFRNNYSRNPRVIIADLSTIFAAEKKRYSLDGTHNSEAGNRRIAEDLLPRINEAINEI